MATPDVRIRLSAEGAAAVVAALEKVAAAGENIGKKTKKGAGLMGSALNLITGNVKEIVGSLVALASVAALTKLGESAIEAGHEMGLMAQRVGASVENLSALRMAAKLTDIDMTDLQRSMGLFARNMDLAQQGGTAAGKALKRLGLSFKDLVGKDAVQQLEMVSVEMAKLKDSPEKTALAMELFSRKGASLIPIMNLLGKKGIAGLREELHNLGLEMTGETADAMGGMADSFKLLGLLAQGSAQTFLTGFAPPFVDAINTIVKALTKDGVGGMELFGVGVGYVLRFVLGLIGFVVNEIVMMAHLIVQSVVDVARISTDLLTRNYGKAVTDAMAMKKKLGDIWTSGKQRDVMFGQMMFGAAPKPEAAAAGGKGTALDPEEAASAHEAAVKKAADAVLKTTEENLKALERSYQRYYEQGMISYAEYEAKRRAIAEARYQAQIAAARKERLSLDREADPAGYQQKVDAIQAREDQARTQRDEAIAASIENERVEGLRAKDELLAAANKVREAEGRHHEVRMAEIEKEVAAYKLGLQQKLGPNAEGLAENVQAYSDALTNAANAEEAQRVVSAALSQLELERAAIQQRVAENKLGEVGAERELLVLNKDRLKTIRALAVAALAAAQASKDPAAILAAQQQLQTIDAMVAATNVEAQNMQTLRAGIKDAATSGLAQFFRDAASGAMSLGEALRGMGASIADAISQITAKLLSELIVKQALAMFPGFATGGFIRGAGTGTSDSILARLSHGEFVVRAAVVRQPGMLDYLRAVNAGVSQPGTFMPRFAEGGEVSVGASTVGGTITVGLDQGLILQAIKSPAGQRTIINVISRNPRAVNSATGRG